MPISHEHKCIFFHIPKCAGSSIEKRLGVGEDDTKEIPDIDILWGRQKHDLYETVGPILEQDDETVFLYAELQHLTPEQMLKGRYVSRDVFDRYYKFTFIRNPWDKLVSEYFWKMINRFDTFREFLDWVATLDMDSELNQHPHFIPQHRFVYNRKDRAMVDFVGRYEELFKGWESVRKHLGLEKGLPHLLWSKHKRYTKYYDQSSIDLVAEIYRKDIELFGYKFGD